MLGVLCAASYRSRYRWVRAARARALVAGGITADLLSRAWALARRIGRTPSGLFARWVDRWEIRSVVAGAAPVVRRPMPRQTAVEVALGLPPRATTAAPRSAGSILDDVLVGLGLRAAPAPVPAVDRRTWLRSLWVRRDQTRGIGTRRVFG